MCARRCTLRRLVCLTAVLLGAATGGSTVAAQVVQQRPWRDPLLAIEPFTEAYRRAREWETAEAMLKEEPLSMEAATRLLSVGRTDRALDVLEQVVRRRPECSQAVLLALGYRDEPFIQSKRGRINVARAQALGELATRTIASLTTDGASTTLPANGACEASDRGGAPGANVDGPLSPRLLLAQQEVALATSALRQRRSWSPRSVERALAPGMRRLLEVADSDRGRDGQWALAELARVAFEAGRLRDALGHYSALEARYPAAETAWAAGMRAAQLLQTLGEPEKAGARFAEIGRAYGRKPTVSALAALYEARAWEGAGRYDDALAAYRTALSAWPEDAPGWRGLNWRVLYFADARSESLWPQDVTRRSIVERVGSLTRAARREGLRRIERATWFLDHRRASEAASLIRASLATETEPGDETALRQLGHRAAFDEAVSTMSRSGRLSGPAKEALRRLCGEPFDPWVGVGCAIHASVLAVDGHRSEAVAVLRRTLNRWPRERESTRQTVKWPKGMAEAIAREATAVRDAVFTSLRLEAHDWARRDDVAHTKRLLTAPFLIMPDTVTVLTADGIEIGKVDLPAPAIPSTAVVMSGLEARELWKTVESLSGCDDGRRTRRLNELWNGTVGFTPWYCSLGWTWYTTPVVGSIEFMDAEETRARVVVPFDVAGGGRTVIVEKGHGAWKVTSTEAAWEY